MHLTRVLRVLLTSSLLVACSVPTLEPHRVDPPSLLPLPAPLATGVLAVVDLEERRPDFERRDVTLSDTFLAGLVPDGLFWSFQGEDPENLPTIKDAEGRTRYLRFTGERAWTWHPYPAPGPLSDRSVEANIGLADLVAHVLGSRGVWPRIIRVATPEEAKAAGATWVLGGGVDHFASLFEEEKLGNPVDREAARPVRIWPRLEFDLWMVHEDSPVWSASYALSESAVGSHLRAHFGVHRSSQYGDTIYLDAANFPRMAFEDMTSGVHRELSEFLLLALAEMEDVLSQATPEESSPH